MIDLQTCFKFAEIKIEAKSKTTNEPADRDFVSGTWVVPHDLPYLNGHFPNQPIVPGVAILDATFELISRAFGTGQLSAVKHSKFLKPLSPGSKVDIECRRVVDHEWAVDWSICKNDETELVARLLLVI